MCILTFMSADCSRTGKHALISRIAGHASLMLPITTSYAAALRRHLQSVLRERFGWTRRVAVSPPTAGRRFELSPESVGAVEQMRTDEVEETVPGRFDFGGRCMVGSLHSL